MGQGHCGLLLLGKPVPAPSRAALTLEVHVAPFPLPFFFMKMFTRSLCHLGLLFPRTELSLRAERLVFTHSWLWPSP